MGVFDFIRDAGAKVFGKDDEPDTTKPLSAHLRDHGISPEGLRFAFSNEKVTVSGRVASQELREKIVTIIGNVEGVAAVDDRLEVGPPAADAPPPAAGTGPAPGPQAPSAAPDTPAGSDWISRTYTVQPGDTLSGIAERLYGSASKYPQIFEANRPMLKDPDKIYPGQVLRIPRED